MRKSILVALITSISAYAADPTPVDAPFAVALEEAQPAPFPGILLNKPAAVAAAKELTSCRAEIPALRESVSNQIPLWVPIVVGVLAAGAAASATYGIVKAVSK